MSQSQRDFIGESLNNNREELILISRKAAAFDGITKHKIHTITDHSDYADHPMLNFECINHTGGSFGSTALEAVERMIERCERLAQNQPVKLTEAIIAGATA